MKIIPILIAIFLVLSTLLPASATVCDTWGGGNCIDAHPQGSSSYSSGGGDTRYGIFGSDNGTVFFDGHRTQQVAWVVKQCGNASCTIMNSVTMFPIALLLDIPTWTVKGVGYGVYYGAVGVGKGAVAIGQGVAYPFKSAAQARAEKQRKAREIVACTDRPVGGESFDAYRAWEKCKKDILKRQKALTKNDPSNRDNELWCKGHVPLSSGPNTENWLSRCNPGGAISFGSAPATQAPATGEKEPTPAPFRATPNSPEAAPSQIPATPSATNTPAPVNGALPKSETTKASQ